MYGPFGVATGPSRNTLVFRTRRIKNLSVFRLLDPRHEQTSFAFGAWFRPPEAAPREAHDPGGARRERGTLDTDRAAPGEDARQPHVVERRARSSRTRSRRAKPPGGRDAR